MCLQETYSVLSDERFWQSEWGGNILFSHGERHSRGVAICFGKNFMGEVTDVCRDHEGRYIICTVKYNEKDFIISNTYAPNNDSPQFFIDLFRQMNLANSPEWIMVGDFNLTLNPNFDRKTLTKSLNVKQSSMLLKECMQQYDLHDVWREMHPDTLRYSWHGRVNSSSRIDMFLISGSLMDRVSKSDICSSVLSDHSALFMEIELTENQRGPGFWKLNESLLDHNEYVNITTKAIDEVQIKNSKEKLDPLLN